MTYSRIHSLIERLLILPALVLCIGSPGAFAAAVGGGTYYVSEITGSDNSGDGSEANPWRTIDHAVEQAGGGAPTIMVGPGFYGFFEARIDEYDDMGITITGPGDGSAELFTDGHGFFWALDYVSGPISISGFDVTKEETGSEGELLKLISGGEEVLINDIHADGLGLLTVYAPSGGDYMVSNNEVVGASTGVYVGFSADTSSSTITGSLSVVNNSFVDVSYAVSYTAEAYTDEWLDVNISVVGNDFESCSEAFYAWSSVSETGAIFNPSIVIDSNNILDCESPIYLSFQVDSTNEVNRNIEITNNEIVGSSGGVYFTTSIEEYVDYNETVLIAGNSIQGVYSGIYQSFEVSSDSATVDREWSILNNVIEGCSGAGIYLYQEYSSDERGECNYDLTIDGNAITDNDYLGINVSHYISYTAASEINHTITRNNISNNESTGIYLAVYGSTADIDHNVVIRGNVIEGNDPGYGQISISAHMDTDGFYDLDCDMGNPSAFGYNTIVADGDNPSSSVSFHAHPSSSMVTAQFNAVGNWWGTQDAGEIEDRVFHGPDSSEYFTADLSNPLPDSLDFTAAYDADLGLITFTAGSDAGFVAYAGDLTLMLNIEGALFAVPSEAVSDDYQTITLAGDPLPGVYDVCLTNPGGQSGCSFFTVGDDEDCSQNQIPTAVSEDADTDAQTAVTVDVTANDWDPNGNLDPTTVVIIDTPDKGAAVVNADGSITYTPGDDLLDDSDAMTYVVYDTCGSPSNAATLHVRIGGHVNLIPTAGYDEVITEQDAAIIINVLDNDYDPDGMLDTGSVQIIDTPGKGAAVVNADGSITYTPNAGLVATTDTFTYTVNDDLGATSNAATVGVMINYIMDSEEITSGVGGNAGGRKTQGARGGLGNGGTPTYGGTRNP